MPIWAFLTPKVELLGTTKFRSFHAFPYSANKTFRRLPCSISTPKDQWVEEAAEKIKDKWFFGTTLSNVPWKRNNVSSRAQGSFKTERIAAHRVDWWLSLSRVTNAPLAHHSDAYICPGLCTREQNCLSPSMVVFLDIWFWKTTLALKGSSVSRRYAKRPTVWECEVSECVHLGKNQRPNHNVIALVFLGAWIVSLPYLTDILRRAHFWAASFVIRHRRCEKKLSRSIVNFLNGYCLSASFFSRGWCRLACRQVFTGLGGAASIQAQQVQITLTSRDLSTKVEDDEEIFY